jgi:hypothetical protein
MAALRLDLLDERSGAQQLPAGLLDRASDERHRDVADLAGFVEDAAARVAALGLKFFSGAKRRDAD